MTINQLVQEQRELIRSIAAKHGAKNVRIFGSVVRGEADSNSDLDLLVDLGNQLSPWFPVRLIRELEATLHCKVDVVTEKGLKDRIREQVLAEAKPL
jgi:predicted nucleotidyltransferase